MVNRESARLLENAIIAALKSSPAPESPPNEKPVAVDFDGVEGIAPSFLDELLSVLESVVRESSSGCERGVIVRNPPTRLSLKFEAVARGHGMTARALPDGSWLLTPNPNATA
ncbi:MAG: STAS-like domain-containing protein [Planctomycetes bacterium]|nr:STAS-like domain-containing protein [Planctomycetota bacterium]